MLVKGCLCAQRQVEDRLSCPWPFKPTAAGKPHAIVCYDLEEVMCESKWNVLSSWPGQHVLAKHNSLKNDLRTVSLAVTTLKPPATPINRAL